MKPHIIIKKIKEITHKNPKEITIHTQLLHTHQTITKKHEQRINKMQEREDKKGEGRGICCLWRTGHCRGRVR